MAERSAAKFDLCTVADHAAARVRRHRHECKAVVQAQGRERLRARELRVEDAVRQGPHEREGALHACVEINSELGFVDGVGRPKFDSHTAPNQPP